MRAFVDARLFLTDKDEHHPVATLAHEAILRHWWRLAAWIERNADFLRARDRISVAAERWSGEGRDAACLLQEGKPLARTVDVIKNHAARHQPDQALAAVEKVPAIRCKVFELPHPDIWKTLGQKAAIIGAAGRAAEARDIATQADAMKQQHKALESKRAVL